MKEKAGQQGQASVQGPQLVPAGALSTHPPPDMEEPCPGLCDLGQIHPVP